MRKSYHHQSECTLVEHVPEDVFKVMLDTLARSLLTPSSHTLSERRQKDPQKP